MVCGLFSKRKLVATGSKFPPAPERRKPSKFCNKNQQRHREIHKLRRRRWPFQLCEPTGNITLIRSSNGTARIPLHVRMPASRGTGTHGGTSATFWGRTHQPCQLQGKGEGNGCTPFPCPFPCGAARWWNPMSNTGSIRAIITAPTGHVLLGRPFQTVLITRGLQSASTAGEGG